MPLPATLYCGTSGWSYPHWNGVVYPAVKNRSFHTLEYLAQFFDAVEINTTFYQPLRPEIAHLWLRKIASYPRFQFTAKLHRRFTHERCLDEVETARFKEGLWPLLRARRFGCLLMQFPWTFRYTEENRNFVIQLRRAFHEFPLAVEMRHGSWMRDEALGTLIDYRLGFCNIDQAPYTKAMPPTSHLTSEIGYVRMHGRNPLDWRHEFAGGREPADSGARHDYLYTCSELQEWQARIEHIRQFAARTFVFANNDVGGKAAVNALQLNALLGDERRVAPPGLLLRYPKALAGWTPEGPVQRDLFERTAA